MPAWQQSELQIIASLINDPTLLEQVEADLNPHHFFQPVCAASVLALLQHYEATGQVLGWDALESKLKEEPWLKASELEIDMRLLRVAPPMCKGCVVNTILWFGTERRVFRGFSDAVEAMAEQDMNWRDAAAYLFQALDLPPLKDNDVLGRIQAGLLKLDNCAHSLNYSPKEWAEYLRVDDGTADLVAINVLSQLVQAYVEDRCSDALPSFTADSPEFDGVTAAEAKAALERLHRTGLITIERGHRFPLDAGASEVGEAVMLLRPTAKTLTAMLKADRHDGSDQPGASC